MVCVIIGSDIVPLQSFRMHGLDLQYSRNDYFYDDTSRKSNMMCLAYKVAHTDNY